MPEELEFEKPLLELENRIAELRASSDTLAARDEIAALEERLRRLQQRTYASLTPWQRTQLARHPKRPHTLDYFRLLLEDFLELQEVLQEEAEIIQGVGALGVARQLRPLPRGQACVCALLKPPEALLERGDLVPRSERIGR